MITLNIYSAKEITKYINMQIECDLIKHGIDYYNPDEKITVIETICSFSSASTFQGSAFLITHDYIKSERKEALRNNSRYYIIYSTICDLIEEHSLPNTFIITRDPLSVDDFEVNERVPF